MENMKIKNPFPKHITQFIRKIDKTHKGLGIPFLIQYIFYTAKVSVLWIGVKGSGKSVIIENSILPSKLANWVDISLYQITKSMLVEKLGYQANKTILLRLTELAQLSSYQKKVFMSLVGTLITSKNFEYKLSKEEKMVIENCDLVITAGIQPITFSKMTIESVDWEQFASDRLVKLLLINPIREKSIPQKPNIDVELLFSKYYNGKLKWKQVDYSKLLKLFKRQLTIWRSEEYIKKLIEAFTRILGLKTITQKTVNLLYLVLYPYMHSFNELNIRLDLESDRQIWGAGLELFSALANYSREGKALNGITYYELMDMLDVKLRAIKQTISMFRDLEIDLLEVKTIREGRTQKTYIRLNDNFRFFFNDFYHLILNSDRKK